MRPSHPAASLVAVVSLVLVSVSCSGSEAPAGVDGQPGVSTPASPTVDSSGIGTAPPADPPATSAPTSAVPATTTTAPPPALPLFEFVDVPQLRAPEPYISRTHYVESAVAGTWNIAAELRDSSTRTTVAQIATISPSESDPTFSGFADLPLGDATESDIVDARRIDGLPAVIGNVGHGADRSAAVWFLEDGQWRITTGPGLVIFGAGDGRFTTGRRTGDDGAVGGIIEIGPDGPTWLVDTDTNVQLFDDGGTVVVIDSDAGQNYELSAFDGTRFVALAGPPEADLFKRQGNDLEATVQALTGDSFWRVYRSTSPSTDEWREISFPPPTGVVQNPLPVDGFSAWTAGGDQVLQLTEEGTLAPLFPQPALPDGSRPFATTLALSDDGTSVITELGNQVAVFEGSWTFVDGIPELGSFGVTTSGAWSSGEELIVAAVSKQGPFSLSSTDGATFADGPVVPVVEGECGRGLGLKLFDARVVDTNQRCTGYIEFADAAIPDLLVDASGGIIVEPVMSDAEDHPVVAVPSRDGVLRSSVLVEGAWSTSELGPNGFRSPCVGRAGTVDFVISDSSTGFAFTDSVWAPFSIPGVADRSQCFVHGEVTAFASPVTAGSPRDRTLFWSRDRVEWQQHDFGTASVRGLLSAGDHLVAYGSTADSRPGIWVEAGNEWRAVSSDDITIFEGAEADSFDHLSVVGNQLVAIDYSGPAATVMVADLETALDAIDASAG